MKYLEKIWNLVVTNLTLGVSLSYQQTKSEEKMKYLLLLLIIIPEILFSQEWNKDKWEKHDFYSKSEQLSAISRTTFDIKCFDDGSCYAVGVFHGLYLEVFKLDDSNKRWERIYDGIWDINTPQEEWPGIILDNPRGVNIINDSTVFIYFENTPLINVFNFITQEFDTVHYNPAYPFGDAILNEDGYGMASIGNFVYTTTNSWKDNKHKDIEFPSSAFYVPIRILNDNRFSIADYDHGKCYFIVSTDGLEWERFPVGDFYPFKIYFSDNELGFITGGISNKLDTKDDVIYKTTDGGKSWYEVLNQYNQPASWGIYDIIFLGDSIGIATSIAGLVYTSKDQGNTWDYDVIDHIDQTIYNTYLSYQNEKCYMLIRSQGIFSYDVSLLGITSVPFYNYKELTVYPNPFNTTINLSTDGVIDGLFKVKIYNSSSELVYEDTDYVSNGFQLSTDLPAGAYYLLLEGDKYYYKKIMKE